MHRNRNNSGAGKPGTSQVNRVAGTWHQRRIAGAQEHPHQVGQPFLGANRGDDFGFGVEVHVKEHLVAIGHREAEMRNTLARAVAMVLGVVGRFGQLGDSNIRARQVGVSEAEVHHVTALGPCSCLQAVDGGKDVRG